MTVSRKPSNPKDAIAVRKRKSSTVPQLVLAELGVAMLEGAIKYGRHNYRAIGVKSSVYYDAACGHIDDWWEGEDIDPDSGISHITKAIASLVVLRDSMIFGSLNDDRPPKHDVAKHKAEMEEIIGKMCDDNVVSVNPYTEK